MSGTGLSKPNRIVEEDRREVPTTQVVAFCGRFGVDLGKSLLVVEPILKLWRKTLPTRLPSRLSKSLEIVQAFAAACSTVISAEPAVGT